MKGEKTTCNNELNMKHSETLFSEFRCQFEEKLYFNVDLYTCDSSEPTKCSLLILLAASDFLQSIISEEFLHSEEDISIILPDTSAEDLVNCIKSIYGNITSSNEKQNMDIFSLLGIRLKSSDAATDSNQIDQNNFRRSTIETLMTFNLPSNLTNTDSVVDLKDISIEDLNMINTSTIINNLDVNNVLDIANNDSTTVQNKIMIKTDKSACDKCFKRFNTEKKLHLHKLRVHGGGDGSKSTFKCNECDLNLASANNLEIHLRSHSGQRPFSCNECEKSFASLHYLMQHKEFHRKTKDFECNICGKKYQNFNALSQHKVDHHSNVKYQCGKCQKLFSAKRYLKEHEKKKHSGAGVCNYDCEVCGKVLSGKNELKIHSRIHSGEKPYHCEECDKYFRARSTFTIHMKSHTGTKNAVCEECGKRFIQWGDLRKHMRTHTGERPFKCNSCGRAFARKDYLIKHEKTHKKKKLNPSKESKRAAKPPSPPEETNRDPVTSITSGETVLTENVVIDVSDLRTLPDIQVVRILDPEEDNIDTLKTDENVMYVITN